MNKFKNYASFFRVKIPWRWMQYAYLVSNIKGQ